MNLTETNCREIFQSAYEKRYTWSPKFNGYKGKCIFSINDDSYEGILKSVLKGSGQKAHLDVVALNVSLVLWAAGVEDDIEKGFEKALFSMSKAKPWDKFLLLKTYLES